LDANGVVYAWGDNTHGQLGRGDDPNASLPDIVHGLPPIAAIAAGGYYALALDRDDALWAWGLNDRGQLGDGTTVMRGTPQPVPGLGRVEIMAAGVEHALSLQEDGTLMAWGDDRAYQLGVQLAEERSLHPVVVTLKRQGREKN
jgi:alpha-tubulin suppressor-like RCC1 family protein